MRRRAASIALAAITTLGAAGITAAGPAQADQPNCDIDLTMGPDEVNWNVVANGTATCDQPTTGVRVEVVAWKMMFGNPDWGQPGVATADALPAGAPLSAGSASKLYTDSDCYNAKATLTVAERPDVIVVRSISWGGC